ncbi:HEAT repeat domain-containing protein [Sphingomonas sp. ABOLD]|uniref:HEAT repeat protein n=1 Tax=Sphingomonas trueperi TaxID=53317 RepID=A0A7X5XVC9_9SPHN|nr:MULTISPECIES: HEAT repeat domain-containing protein [Sphingomonas]NJB95757.1 hypothetical protein [Sphingomonas trueperi]RSV36152.1 HEAT repeat domain-containing protein [Sphingomonas sp. ABOLE]RSV49182.1 HEAT repeat domain-containing protein [Sphingomonas sp. ABOLD]
MKNLQDVLSVVRHPDFRQTLLDDNERSVLYYNRALGFGDLKRSLQDKRDMTPEEVFALCSEFFTEDRIRKIVAEERACAARNPFYGSSFQPISGEFFGGMVLVSTDQFSAMLLGLDGFEIDMAKRRTPGDRRTLTFGGQHTFLKIYRARDFTLQTWKMDPFADEDDLATSGKTYREGPSLVCEPGDTFHFGADEAFEYTSKVGAHALVLQVQMYRHGLPMALEFDVDSRSLVGAASSAQEPTRLQMLATAMRLFGRQDAGEQMERLVAHPSHYVRWHAMREYLGLNLERAWPLLERMCAEDPHPAVRRAAQKTIHHLSDVAPALAAE